MQTHLKLRRLNRATKPDSDVQVLFAANPGRKAILFIHGFGGNPISTWARFHEILPSLNEMADTDLYFYGYDGLRADLVASAGIFRDFLGRLFGEAAALANESLPAGIRRPHDFGYNGLVIAAHSLGAVISRWALLDATDAGMAWARRTKLVLFAPAHMGANVAGLAIEALEGFPGLRLFSAFARFASPLIDQLKKDSDHLKRLREETQRLLADPANRHLSPALVVIAQYEKIVENLPFPGDPLARSIPDASHTSICKPQAGFTTPVDLLLSCL
jgi:pimeloyl-ACP methyl ester carboxylesterase